MLTLIILTTLLTVFFDALMHKWDWYDGFKKWSMKGRSKFIYRLSSCEFCMRFHLGVISFVLVAFFTFIDLTFILTPFCVAGLLKLIKYDSYSQRA